MGFLNNAVPFSLIIWSQSHISSALASILNASTPLFTVAIAHAVTRDDKMTGGRLAGVLLGLAGVTVMIGLGALQGLGTHVLAQLASLGAAASYAVAGIYGRRFGRAKVSALLVATGQLTGSALLMTPLALIVDRPWTLAPPAVSSVSAVIAMALVSTSFAYIIYFRLLAAAGATNLLLVTFLVPVSAIILGTLFLGEHLEAQHFAGMALIGLGLAAIDGRPARALTRRLRGGRIRLGPQ